MAAADTIDISIIVLNWNGLRFVDTFFESILQQDFDMNRVEILFVDNGSTDGSAEYFQSKQYPHARLIQTGANRGYAGGNNYGFREARGTYVIVCNNDLTFEKSWLSRLVSTADETGADVIVPKLVYADTGKINNAGSMLRPDNDWPNVERGMGCNAGDPEFNERVEVTAFCGASPLFKRSFLEEVGLFDSRFFLYWEDGDLSWRGQKSGKRYIYEPTALAYHSASGTSGGSTSPVFIYYVSRNRVLILLKNGRLYLAFRAFAKVIRDHVIYKIAELARAIRHGHGRRASMKNLGLGLKIVFGILAASPTILMKRYGILKEETL